MSTEQNSEQQPLTERQSTSASNEKLGTGESSSSADNIEISKSIYQNKEITADHHLHLPRHKKKWTDYLMEFFMLFLAVFLGFTAENIRENSSERHREKDYIKSMVQDLKEDVVAYGPSIDSAKRKMLYIDTLITALKTKPYNGKLLHYLHRKYITTFYRAYISQRTLSQLKNAGGMSLISNQAISDSINSYDVSLLEKTKQETVMGTLLDKLREMGWDIYDYSLINEYYSLDKIDQLKDTDIHLELLSEDPKLLKRYLNAIMTWKGFNATYLRIITDEKARAERLMTFLKEQYHL